MAFPEMSGRCVASNVALEPNPQKTRMKPGSVPSLCPGGNFPTAIAPPERSERGFFVRGMRGAQQQRAPLQFLDLGVAETHARLIVSSNTPFTNPI